MTAYIIVGIIGVAIGFGLALVFNHKKPSTFDALTSQADSAVKDIKGK